MPARALLLLLLLVALLTAAVFAVRVVMRAELPPPPVPASMGELEPAVAEIVEQTLAETRDAPRDVDRRVRLGMVYAANELHEPARVALEQAAAAGRIDARAWYHLAHARAAVGDVAGAIEAADRAIAQEPHYLTAQEQRRHWAAMLAGSAAGEPDPRIAAADHWRQALDAYRRGFDAEVDRAEAALDAGHHQQAISMLNKLRRTHEPTLALYLVLGRAYHSAGQPAQAAEIYGLAVDLDPESAHAHHRLAEVLHERVAAASPDERDAIRPRAIEHALRASELDPTSARSLALLGSLYAGQDRVAEAATALRRAAELEPANADYPRRAGTLYHMLERWDDAITLLEQAVERSDQPGEPLLALGRALLDAGRFDEAEAALQRALSARGGDAQRIRAALEEVRAMRE